jgi:hypothetical protein
MIDDVKNILPSCIDVAAARMPSTYEQAKIALISCAKIDECQDWANKAEALASYAKMAGDDSLRRMADRIQARAVRRMGELYKTFNAQGQRTDQLKEGALQKLTQKEVAESAGISEHQAKQAVRVSNVPEEKFEAAIEAPKPATVTALAEMGKQVRTAPTEGFKRVVGAVKRFADFCHSNDPDMVAAGVLPHEAADMCGHVETIDSWLDQFIAVLSRDEATESSGKANEGQKFPDKAQSAKPTPRSMSDFPELPPFLDRRMKDHQEMKEDAFHE